MQQHSAADIKDNENTANGNLTPSSQDFFFNFFQILILGCISNDIYLSSKVEACHDFCFDNNRQMFHVLLDEDDIYRPPL